MKKASGLRPLMLFLVVGAALVGVRQVAYLELWYINHSITEHSNGPPNRCNNHEYSHGPWPGIEAEDPRRNTKGRTVQLDKAGTNLPNN